MPRYYYGINKCTKPKTKRLYDFGRQHNAYCYFQEGCHENISFLREELSTSDSFSTGVLIETDGKISIGTFSNRFGFCRHFTFSKREDLEYLIDTLRIVSNYKHE